MQKGYSILYMYKWLFRVIYCNVQQQQNKKHTGSTLQQGPIWHQTTGPPFVALNQIYTTICVKPIWSVAYVVFMELLHEFGFIYLIKHSIFLNSILDLILFSTITVLVNVTINMTLDFRSVLCVCVFVRPVCGTTTRYWN